MTFSDVAWVRDHCRTRHVGLLLLLMTYADKNGVAFPSIETLAKVLRRDPRHVRRQLQDLKDCGDLHIDHGGRKGDRRYNVYRLRLRAETGQVNGNETGGKGAQGPSNSNEIEGASVQNRGRQCPNKRAPVSKIEGASTPPTVREPSKSVIISQEKRMRRTVGKVKGRKASTTSSSPPDSFEQPSGELSEETREASATDPPDSAVPPRRAQGQSPADVAAFCAALTAVRGTLGDAFLAGLTDADVRKMLLRYPVAWWLDVLRKIAASPFLRGETGAAGPFVKRKWLLTDGNAEKIASGELKDRPRGGGPGNAWEQMSASERMAQRRREDPITYLHDAWYTSCSGVCPPEFMPIATLGHSAVAVHPLEWWESVFPKIRPHPGLHRLTLAWLLAHPEVAESIDAGATTLPDDLVVEPGIRLAVVAR